MANMNVTFGELNAKADQLAVGRDEINTTLAKLQGQINALIAQGFTTDKASGAFADAYNRFTSGATNAIGGLDDLALFLRTTATTLGDVDAQIASRIAR
ncbi:WXG100 family type VII secretion target [Agromyces laixinhei]|uniref:WXG100 family type VII secretion target n=1 Tax=Agromyces laixinhei TaxID=2585717 RepID=UPI0012EDDE1D|nr:WXG100 family type VII secretion target [Agromyces laixinhei]